MMVWLNNLCIFNTLRYHHEIIHKLSASQLLYFPPEPLLCVRGCLRSSLAFWYSKRLQQPAQNKIMTHF